MTPRTDETFEEYVARHIHRERVPQHGHRGLPTGWRNRTRRRVAGPPPDLEAEENHVLSYSELHTGLHEPRIRDLKRTPVGGCAYLIEGRCGSRVMLVVDRAGRVLRIGSQEEFHSMKEVL